MLVLGDDHLIRGGGGGGWQMWSGQVIYFQHELGRKLYFQVYQGQNIYFHPQQNFKKAKKNQGGGSECWFKNGGRTF